MRLRRTQWRHAPFRVVSYCADVAASASDLSTIAAPWPRWAGEASGDAASLPVFRDPVERSETAERH